MAKIPDYTALNRAIPQVSGNIDTRGVGANIGEGIASASQQVLAVQEEKYAIKQRNLVAKANADLSIDLIGEASALSADNDYDTQEERFTKFSESRLGEYASTITDPNARNLFMQQARQKTAVARERVRAGAWTKEKDVNRGAMLTTLDTLRNAAVESGEIDILHNDAKNVIDASVESRYIDSEEAAKLYDKWRSDTTVSRIEYLPPEKRLGTLKEKWAKDNMDPEVRAKLMREAEEESLDEQASNIVMDMESRGLDFADTRSEIKKIKDHKKRAAVQKERDYIYGRKEYAATAESDEINKKYFYDIATTGFRVSQIPKEEREKLDNAHLKNLMNAEQNFVSGKAVISDEVVILNLDAKIGRKDYRGAVEYFNKNSSKLSRNDVLKYGKVTQDGVTALDESPFTMRQDVKDATPGMKEEQRGPIYTEMRNWEMDFKEVNGAYPTGVERVERINHVLRKIDTTPGFMGTFSGDKAYYEMDDDEKRIFENAKKWLKDTGREVTDDSLQKAYNVLYERANAND